MSLPAVFVFRIELQDPHPTPWIRVKLSCALGHALYPHPQWEALSNLWQMLYPIDGLDEKHKAVLTAIERSIPEFVELLVNFRPQSLRGKSLKEVMPLAERHPSRLGAYYKDWIGSPAKVRSAPQSLVFATIGQARADGNISPEAESKLLADLLSFWAMHSALDTAAICAMHPRLRLAQPAPIRVGELTVN